MTHHKNLPTIIGYSLALVTFLVVAVLGVTYATGYRWDWEKLAIEKTGVLAVTTRPTGATVWIDGKQYTKKTPIAVRNVAAGDYEVKVALEGYREYGAKVAVLPGLATELSGIDLVLSEPVVEQVAAEVELSAGDGDSVVYRTKDKKWWRADGGTPTEITFDRLPAHVKSALVRATKVEWIKKSGSSNSWAANLTVDGKKWLAIFDMDGFRGALLAAPLNQLQEKYLDFIDNDHLLGVVGSTVYGLDLNTNKLTTVSKTALAAQAWAGKTVVFSKINDGEIEVTEDGNVFDDRVGQKMKWTIPTGKDQRLVEEIDRHLLLTVNTGGSETLWLLVPTDADSLSPIRIASGFQGLSVNKDKKFFVYAAGKKLMKYDIVTKTETLLREYSRDVSFEGQRNNSIFLQTDSGLEIVDTLGQNSYAMNDRRTQVMLANDSRMYWTVDGGNLSRFEVRRTNGIFGFLMQDRG